MTKELYGLPNNLPKPKDDGACDHLVGMTLPNIQLPTTSGHHVNFSQEKGMVIYYFYPMIGNPESLPGDDWNSIPGARGCTPQSCAFRDNFAAFQKRNIRIYGISSQTINEQIEAHKRLGLPFDLVSDSSFSLSYALKLPTFNYHSKTYIKRLTIVAINHVIQKVLYPVFPSYNDSSELLTWFNTQPLTA